MDDVNLKRICPVEKAWGLDNSIRKWLQNPQKILSPFIGKGMVVLDLGCGPGYFSVEMARMLHDSGKVIAADVQEGMLEKIRQKIDNTELAPRIELHKCGEDTIGISEKVDFVLAFYMIHEVPSQEKLFRELKSILKQDGEMFIIEPRFHVSRKSFESMMDLLVGCGFEIVGHPKVFFSRSVVVRN